MESQPQNPEIRNNPENFHSCKTKVNLRFIDSHHINIVPPPLYNTDLDITVVIN